MARPVKSRRVCGLPPVDSFGPVGREAEEWVELTLEEYETIRLIDLLDCTQEECASQMGVARTTVQAVYNSARRKLAACLVYGRQLRIRGGNYTVCPEAGSCCGKSCRKGRCRNRRCENISGGDNHEDCSNIRE
ncbi:MAG: DUF134 domain-containing protein [Clostridium sp.]|nr:DUF134 domain-containing protein [Clostridium sp.]